MRTSIKILLTIAIILGFISFNFSYKNKGTNKVVDSVRNIINEYKNENNILPINYGNENYEIYYKNYSIQESILKKEKDNLLLEVFTAINNTTNKKDYIVIVKSNSELFNVTATLSTLNNELNSSIILYLLENSSYVYHGLLPFNDYINNEREYNLDLDINHKKDFIQAKIIR